MKYFKISEFEKNGVKVTNDDIKYNIESLVNNLLDKVRAYYGKPIYIIEGYNPYSEHFGHTVGVAADITTKNKQGNINIFEYIKTLTFDEVSVNGDYESIHVTYYPKNRKEVNEDFRVYFNEVHPDFLKRLSEKFPALTPNDHRLCSYLYLGMSTKEIAALTFREIRSVESSRLRLRKKLGITGDTTLHDFLHTV